MGNGTTPAPAEDGGVNSKPINIVALDSKKECIQPTESL